MYSGGTPSGSHTTWFDSLATIGVMVSELFLGIDCPRHAKFYDFVHFLGGMPHLFKNSACIFELDRGVPLRRHYSSDGEGGYYFAQGMPDNVLVFRHAVTVYNYDYIIDIMFHQAGQIEGKVSLSGYLQSHIYTGKEMDKYGHIVNIPSCMAHLHHHMVHFKVDLDIKGRKNRFETLDIKLEELKVCQLIH